MGPHPYAAPPRYAATEAELRAECRRPLAGDGARVRARHDGLVAARSRASRGTLRHRPIARECLPLMLDVGVADPYVDQSRDFHATLERLGVAHAYAEWPGAHDWDYWRVARA